MKAMNREAYLEDLEDLFERQPDAMPESAAFAIHGYIIGLLYADEITMEDYERFRKRIPLSGEELSEAGVNI